MGANHNGVKRAVILALTMMFAVAYSTVNAFVSLIHVKLPPKIQTAILLSSLIKKIFVSCAFFDKFFRRISISYNTENIQKEVLFKKMQIINHTVVAVDGLGALTASRLVKIAAESGCTVTLDKNGKTVNAKKLYAVIGLDVKKGDKITFTVSGPSESDTADGIKKLLLS